MFLYIIIWCTETQNWNLSGILHAFDDAVWLSGSLFYFVHRRILLIKRDVSEEADCFRLQTRKTPILVDPLEWDIFRHWAIRPKRRALLTNYTMDEVQKRKIVAKLLAGRTRLWIPAGTRSFFIFQKAQIASAARTLWYSVGNRGWGGAVYPDIKRAKREAALWPPNVEVKTVSYTWNTK